MRKAVLCAAMAIVAVSSFAKSHLLNVKIAVTNSTAQDRRAENVVLPMADLRKVAPGLRAGQVIVTATDAATEAEDAAVVEAVELPSQVDDLDGDNQADELAFQLDLKPRQTRIVTVTYGEANRIFRLRSLYPKRTDALFATKIEGLGWESERNAWRIYFDSRNAIDLYGKRRPSLLLQMFATPEYDYHAESPDGRDIYMVGEAMGIGSVGVLVDGSLTRVADVDARRYRVIANGPVRSIVELSYEGWKAGGRKITLQSRITQWAGDRGFTHAISAQGADNLMFATGLPLKAESPALRSDAKSPAAWVATYGKQVLAPGASATEPLQDTNLGLLVVLAPGTEGNAVEDRANHLIAFPLRNGRASWYVAAAWDQEASNNRIGSGAPKDSRENASRVLPSDAIRSKDEFVRFADNAAAQMRTPAEVRILSNSTKPQPAPSDTLAPASSKTYQEAIELVRAQIDRDAAKWEPVLTRSQAVSANKGLGFFTDGDNKSGEWEERQGFFWTGSFWTGELWKMYAGTKEDKYLRWAEEWTNPLVGQEAEQNHDSGFLYYYSSVAGYGLTQEPRLRESAIRAAERLEKLYNPSTQMIAAWQPGGDDSIVDSMMNLQLLWWATKETGQAKWQEIGLKHALRSAEWLVREDGSTVQSVHYNPGDNRREMELRGASVSDISVRVPAGVGPGQIAFTHTHQGFAADTAWSRGTAWALYGFATAYAETRDPRMLATAQKIATYVVDELPEDGVPWYDFYDEGVRFRNRDTSAAVLIAGGLLRLSRLVPDKQQARLYRTESERITQSVIDRYLTPVAKDDRTPPGVLRHGCGTHPQDGMLIYGQYYLLETLLELESMRVAGRH